MADVEPSESIEVFPGLVAACGRRFTDAGGRRYSPIMALALWHLARHQDKHGAGRVPAGDLKAAGLKRWTRDTYYRALRDAQALGLVQLVTRKRDGAEMVEARGIQRVATLLELPSVGARKVSIPLAALAKTKTFKAALWSAYQAGRARKTDSPITRGTLRKLAGLPESTQRRYEASTQAAAGERVTQAEPNAVVVAQVSLDAALGVLAAAREFMHGGCFIRGDLVLRPIGNTYSSSLPQGSRSKARKLNRALSLSGLVPTAAGQPTERLFFADRAKAQRAARRGQAADVPLVATGEHSKDIRLWAPAWDSWSLRHVAGIG